MIPSPGEIAVLRSAEQPFRWNRKFKQGAANKQLTSALCTVVASCLPLLRFSTQDVESMLVLAHEQSLYIMFGLKIIGLGQLSFLFVAKLATLLSLLFK